MSGTSKDSLPKSQERDSPEKWLFKKEQLENTPSRRDNVTTEKELNYRQQAANLIQDMGQRLPVNQLTINTAIVYMHRFYMFHSFQAFSRFVMAPTALFLAAKVEEQPRKLEHVIKVCHACLHPDKPHLDVHSDAYLKQAQELVQNELIMLQTLGFDISIDHPHTHVVKCTQLVKASRDLSQMAYFMATNSLHLTTFCLQYKPTVVSAMCIHLSCKWSNYEIPLSSAGKAYWTYMDPTITEALLENIINEFLQILNLCPTRLRKLKNYKPSARDGGGGGSTPTSKDGQQPKPSTAKASHPPSHATHPVPEAQRPSSSQSDLQKKHPSLTFAEYKHKREKEQQQQSKSNIPQKEADRTHALKPHKTGVPGSSGHPSQRPSNTSHPSSRPQMPPKPGQSHHSHHNVKTGHPGVHGQPNSGLQAMLTGSQNHHVKQERPPPQTKPHGHPEQRRPEKIHPHQPKQPPQQPSGIPGLQKPRMKDTKPVPSQPPQNPSSAPASSAGADDDIALKGIEMKIMEQIKAEKSSSVNIHPKSVEGQTSSTSSQDVKHPPPQANHHLKPPPPKESRSRHSFPGHPHPGHAPPQPHDLTKMSLYEQYKKAPEALKHHLKKKAQTEPLTEEEKLLLHKIRKKEEERQRKKREIKKHKSHHSQPPEGANTSAVEGNNAPSPSGSGPLTVRIKLPPSVRAEMSKGSGTAGSPTAGKVIGSSSGSGSEATVSSPSGSLAKPGRKRAHAHDPSGLSDPTSAKQSRKSEGHHHHHHHNQGSHHSNHDSSRSGSRHHHRSHRHHHQSKPHPSGQKIDEAVFQTALKSAVELVQSGQSGPPTAGGEEKTVPTVTLKRTGIQNGEQEEYSAHSSKHDSKHRSSSKRNKYSGFDPSAPVSSTLPEDLFEGDDGHLSNHMSGGHDSEGQGRNPVVAGSRNADFSSPETGEIRDDEDDMSPFHEHGSGYPQNPIHWRGNSNNNNQPSSSHHHSRQNPTNGAVPPPPSLTHGARMHYPGDPSKGRERLPPPPPLTVKPTHVLDQR